MPERVSGYMPRARHGTVEMLKRVRKKRTAASKRLKVYLVNKDTKHRTAAQNAKILNQQRSVGRDPIYFTRAEKKSAQNEIATPLMKLFATGNYSDIMFGLNEIGHYMIDTIKSHIKRGTSKQGFMRKLSPAYKRRKKAKWGDRPILVASGQLYGSFVHRARVK